MTRTIQMGPEDVPAAPISPIFGALYRTRFQVPAGGTVTFVSVQPPTDTPPAFVRVVLFQTRLIEDSGFEGEKEPYLLIPSAYPWGPRDFPVAAVWEGRHRVDDNFEYTLEILVFDGSGVTTPVWRAMATVEVDD